LIQITETISLLESDLRIVFIRSGGPGGQNVNKVSTGVQLRFNAANSASIPYPVRLRLVNLAKNRITRDGYLVITADRFRSQDQNKKDAVNRLVELIKKAAIPPKPRKKTKPSRASHRKRLHKKRLHSIKKQRRSKPRLDD